MKIKKKSRTVKPVSKKCAVRKCANNKHGLGLCVNHWRAFKKLYALYIGDSRQ